MDKKYNFAVFPGDFNPFHYGHINVLAKASQYVNKILLFVIDTSPERITNIPPPVLDRNNRHNLVQRYISEGYLGDVEAQYELYSGNEQFPEFYLNQKCTLICGTDVFNYNRFRIDEPQYREFGWLIENSRNGIVLVERPGYPPDSTILSNVKERGINVDILKGDCQVGARDIRKNITARKAITGMVPAPLEDDIVEMYRNY
ncbi:MAG: adenylyltransferase/cytidyltransferase family protein [Deltaproteobacteria bacterium]|nr:adenylyltransferase/cytidyltransferase family protein [Deltaproteobacteria bacterium]